MISIKIGDIIKDYRYDEFVEIETEEDIRDYNCVAPELYEVYRKVVK